MDSNFVTEQVNYGKSDASLGLTIPWQRWALTIWNPSKRYWTIAENKAHQPHKNNVADGDSVHMIRTTTKCFFIHNLWCPTYVISMKFGNSMCLYMAPPQVCMSGIVVYRHPSCYQKFKELLRFMLHFSIPVNPTYTLLVGNIRWPICLLYTNNNILSLLLHGDKLIRTMWMFCVYPLRIHIQQDFLPIFAFWLLDVICTQLTTWICSVKFFIALLVPPIFWEFCNAIHNHLVKEIFLLYCLTLYFFA